jgi:NADH-quinone oxidoreductase subunit G
MPRPQIEDITFTIDGREVTAPSGAMLVDAAKYGDVEIPVFCYEPKLGQPVGACRMCLVEVEGIPKLQTACSTPVKDGMVVHTQTERVHDAQRAVVEFLLINHPLDCPVCDKGGECPLQDITYGWGPGTSRFVEPKRHFRKPLELSPLIAIDRERCILCYRCVRFSQEVSEDYQLVLLERSAASYVGTFDGHPYVAPFSGNIVELCPVGALTSSAYRFRARPWEIEGAGTVCTLCPAQCNVELTVRDDKVQRVLARDNPEVDDGWLCDKGRWGYQHTHVDERIVEPLVREGNRLMPATWEKALSTAASALDGARGRIGAVAEGETSNEEALLAARLFGDLGASAFAAGPDDPLDEVLYHPALQARVSDLEFAHAVLVLDCDPIDEAPIWDLRIRKGLRRRGVSLGVAGARPTALDPNASAIARTNPGALEALLVGLDAALAGDEGNLSGAASAAGSHAQSLRRLAALAHGPEDAEDPRDVVIVASERTLSAGAVRALVNVALRLGLDHEGAGLLVIPSSANARGIREAGFATTSGRAVAEAAAGGDLGVLYLLHSDPLRDHPDRALWERALAGARTVIAHESVLTETVREHADVVFPAEAYPEKEGTITHPDGLVQRLRPAIGRPGRLDEGVRAGWAVLVELARRTGHDQVRVLASSMASQQVFEAAYPGLTLDAIAGQGARPERVLAPLPEVQPLDVPRPAPLGDLRLGTWRPLWAGKEVEVSPHLQFARPRQVVELSPVDAGRLGIADGDLVEVGTAGSAGNGAGPTRVRGPVKLRAAMPPGSVFVAVGVDDSPGNVLDPGPVQVERVAGVKAEPVAATVGAAGDEQPEPQAMESPPGTATGLSADGSAPREAGPGGSAG